jgi:hypothetical protein
MTQPDLEPAEGVGKPFVLCIDDDLNVLSALRRLSGRNRMRWRRCPASRRPSP